MKNDDYGFYGKGIDGYVHYRQGMQEAQRNAPSSADKKPVHMPPYKTERQTERRKAPSPLTWRRWSRKFHITAAVSWVLTLIANVILDLHCLTGTPLVITTLFYCLGIIFLLVEGFYFCIWYISCHS